MKKSIIALIFILTAIIVIILGVGIGSVFITPFHIIMVFLHKLFNFSMPESIEPIHVGLVWSMRLPRVILAFLVGSALSVSGTVMQSVMKNPLASSYGLGVSSGAGLGAALVMVTGFSAGASGIILLPLTGLLFGLAAVFAAIIFAASIDRRMSNNTIILTGMVISLFINAIMTSLAAASPQYSQRILLWQLGSFSMKEWTFVGILFPVVLFGIFFFVRFARELDIMTFGEEQANALGIELKRVKWLFIGVTALLTGTAVAFVGIIGFVDLIAPHIVRRFFGSSHKYIVPFSALFGGTFMVASDLIARTVASPSEIPIGSVTALVGAPFFIYVYFRTRKKG